MCLACSFDELDSFSDGSERVVDESNLIYMRARYYDLTSGRFISQDPSRNGENWFSYANSRPVDCADQTGRETWIDLYHVFYQASDDFLEGLQEAFAEYKSSGNADVISEYIIDYWNSESVNFSVGGVWRGLQGPTMKLAVEAEQLEELGFNVNMGEILEVENEYSEIGRLIGVAEEVDVSDI